MTKKILAFVAKWFVISLVIIAVKYLLTASNIMPHQPTFDELEAIAEKYETPKIIWSTRDYNK